MSRPRRRSRAPRAPVPSPSQPTRRARPHGRLRRRRRAGRGSGRRLGAPPSPRTWRAATPCAPPMVDAHESYEKYAFGDDELRPLAKRGKNAFGALGATIIDSLDTLWIMGLTEHYSRARNWVDEFLYFSRDWEASVVRNDHPRAGRSARARRARPLRRRDVRREVRRAAFAAALDPAFADAHRRCRRTSSI